MLYKCMCDAVFVMSSTAAQELKMFICMLGCRGKGMGVGVGLQYSRQNDASCMYIHVYRV